MAELLLELLSEEIPARMQGAAADELKSELEARLADQGYRSFTAASYVTPRRLTVVADGLPSVQPDRREERKGPRLGAPEKALQGFLGSVGLTRDQLETRADRKGEYYVAVIERKGRPTAEVIADLVPDIVQRFAWPKSMRWGAGRLRWVRPLHGILCLFEGAVVPFEVEGIKSGGTTRGHRFMAPAAIEVKDFADYARRLRQARVEIDAGKRRSAIAGAVKDQAAAEGYEALVGEALLNETAGLVEWPVVLLGAIDEAFVRPLDAGGLPPEVLTTAMAKHQKYFSLRDPATGSLAPRFAMVANLEARDGGTEIIAGNERVLRARLSDARFFWNQDRKRSLDARVHDLADIVFHARLGTVRDKVARVEALARLIAPHTGADEVEAARAAHLAKADLTTEMVGEFPDLQGVMGRYYALADGETAAVAEAIRDHYAPQGPNDGCPSAPVSIAVALADKIDTLVGFWLIDEKPTGSKDPYALRRAALGVIRLVLENDLRLALAEVMGEAARLHEAKGAGDIAAALDSLRAFFADRLKVYLKGKGARHDLIDAVFALPGQDDLVLIVARVEALGAFLGSEDGANLLTAYKRASNILRIEEKKDQTSYQGAADPALFSAKEERALHDAIEAEVPVARRFVEAEDFAGAMAAIARLRGPVDAFFDHVTVNTDDGERRRNRLLLLSQIRSALETVADFSKIEG